MFCACGTKNGLQTRFVEVADVEDASLGVSLLDGAMDFPVESIASRRRFLRSFAPIRGSFLNRRKDFAGTSVRLGMTSGGGLGGTDWFLVHNTIAPFVEVNVEPFVPLPSSVGSGLFPTCLLKNNEYPAQSTPHNRTR
jgi:hypothetical protein